jgi:hypothetical protein
MEVPPWVILQKERLEAKLAKLTADIDSGALTDKAVIAMMKQQITTNEQKMNDFPRDSLPYESLAARS